MSMEPTEFDYDKKHIEVAAFRQQFTWAQEFTDREILEILFARNYYIGFQHGTSGHIEYMVIGKLIDVLAQQ